MPPQLKTNKQTDIMRRPQTILLSSMYNLKLSTKKCQIKSGKWDKFLWPSQNIWTLIVTKDIGIYRVIFWATVATSILWACSQENHIVPYTSRQIFPLVHFRVSSIIESQVRQSNISATLPNDQIWTNNLLWSLIKIMKGANINWAQF